MTAVVLTIGTELTRGELHDTNATWLSEQLTNLGCEVVAMVTVRDDVEEIRSVLESLCGKHAFVVGTGGLGPTSDDLTSEAVAAAAGVELERDPASLEAIRTRYVARGREMTERSAKQADFPSGAEALPNAVGTAPGFHLRFADCQGFFLPGVPHEMKRMFVDKVKPRIASSVERITHQVRLRTFGLPESVVADKLAGIEEDHPEVTLGYRASFPEIEVKVIARANGSASAAEVGAKVAAIVRERLGDIVYGEGDESYPAYVGRHLRDRGLTVALAESCTGGMISALLTDVPGSSDYLLLDAVTYSNASKEKLLGVGSEVLRAYGAVSGECAQAMADGARRLADSDIAVSVTGVAGPGGGSGAKPVGTVWMGLARRGEPTRTEQFSLSGDRNRIRRRAAYLALQMIVRAATKA